MSSKHAETRSCAECGCLVVDRAQHRRFHRNIVTVKQQQLDARRARYVGERDDDGELLPDDLADAHVVDDGDEDDAAERAADHRRDLRDDHDARPLWLGE